MTFSFLMILNKNRTFYNFDDTMRFDNAIVDNILLDKII